MSALQFCINTYKRPHLLPSRTLALLSEHAIPKEQIHIFVGGEESDLDSYKSSCGPGYNFYLVPKGLNHSRNFAYQSFPEGTPLVFFDDDLKKIIHKDKDASWNILKESEHAFQECKKNNLNLWGVYPVANRLWMKDNLAVDKFFCYGCGPWGIFNTHQLKQNLSFKEDWERTLYFLQKDGACVRIQYLAPIQAYKKELGGLTLTRTKESEEKEVDVLLEMYPSLIVKKKTEWPELKIDRRKKTEVPTKNV
jgi:hypothetical protein